MKKKKNTAANVIMVVIAVLIIAAVVLFAGFTRGWFGNSSDSASLADVRGVVTLNRSNVTIDVAEDTPLREGDVITCEAGGSASVTIGSGSALAIGEEAVLTIKDPSSRSFAASLDNGELFAFVAEGADPVTLSFELGETVVENAAISLSARKGAQTMNIYSGTADGVSEGNTVSWIGDERTESPLEASSLNAFSIAQLRAANEVWHTCLTNDELDAVVAQREAEKEEQSQAVMSEELQELELENSCTVTIQCDTILNNMDILDPAKAEYVPADGYLLNAVSVPFADGETAFDALVRACEAYDIQIEYSWTPLYDSYYVEGLGQLYEFDCGSESGWMFKVNGWFPNYGCSSYHLEDGDSVVFVYSCKGLGEDVGGSNDMGSAAKG